MKNENSIAKIDNQFVMKSQYSLNANEQKLILFLVSKLDPKNRAKFTTQKVKVIEIRKAFSEEKTNKSIYQRITEMCIRINRNPIVIPKNFVTKKGERVAMPKVLSWFSDIDPFYDEDGDIAIKFEFNDNLKDYLLQLSEYVQISLYEVMPLRGKYTVRMFQIFLAERGRTKEYKNVSNISYGIDELKGILGIQDKYKGKIGSLRDRVIEPIKVEINEKSNQIKIDYRFIKSRRKITGVEFSIYDKKTKKIKAKKEVTDMDYIPSEKDISKLTFAQEKAYNTLVDFGVYEGIAYRQILSTIKGGNVEGYEDIFCSKAIELFLRKEKKKKNAQKSAGAFVKWWTEKKVFDISNDVFFQISESVNEYRKSQDQERQDNREIAKEMTRGDFIELHKKTENQDGKARLQKMKEAKLFNRI